MAATERPAMWPAARERPYFGIGTRTAEASARDPECARKRGATVLFLARPPGDAWVVEHELVFVESDLGAEAP
jgi:hypothetical protein